MLILIGPSASGKTEVAKLLAKKYNITKIVNKVQISIGEIKKTWPKPCFFQQPLQGPEQEYQNID